MRFRFADRDLELMYTDKEYKGRRDAAVVKSFRRVMGVIKAADSERVFYGLAGLHFEKLKRRPGQFSMRLNIQWRLIIEFEDHSPRIVVIVAIEDYH